MKIKYTFTTSMWQYQGKGGWYFISLPLELSTEIRSIAKWQEEGWGRLKILAKINQTEWETAIWFDTKLNTYLLPIKSEIRKKECLGIDETIDVNIWI